MVDENKERREALRTVLISSGQFDVQAVDCEKAISIIAGEIFDLILLDVTLPDRSGFKVLEFLRENHLAGKVIVITGTVELENAIMTAAPGAGDYLVKPYNPRYLLMSIEHVLSDQSPTSLRLQIIKAGEFLKSTPTGELDKEASIRGLAQIAAAGAILHDYTVLIDLREIKSHLSISEIFDLGDNLMIYGDTFQRKTALLVRADEDLKQARYFEHVSQSRGFNVRVFTVFEASMLWLSSVTQLKET